MPDLIKIGEMVTSHATASEQIEAYVLWERETSIRVYASEIESLTSAEAAGIGIRVICDGRVGISYAGTLDQKEIERTLSEARDNARFGSLDEFAGVAEPDGLLPPTLNLWSQDILETSTDKKIALALELEKLTLSKDKRIRSLNSANYGDVSVESAIVNSRGISTFSSQTYCWAWAYALASQDSETQTGYGLHASRGIDGLDIEFAAAEAANKATRMLGATKPKSGIFTAVFEPDITAALLGIVAGTLSAESVQKGRSIFSGRIGEEVGSTGLNLIDDPSDPRFFSAASYDDEGLASRRNQLIENGVLQQFLYDSYTGRKDKTHSTGSAIRGGVSGSCTPGPRAIMVAPGQDSPQEMIAKIDEGVLIQSISGVHSGVNPISGDFSVGAEGIRISNGELSGPIKEFTIASSLQKMLKDVRTIGNDLTFRPGGTAGVSLVIDNINVSGA